MAIKFYKKQNSHYVLARQDQRFHVEFTKEKVVLHNDNLVLASLELSNSSASLVTSEFKITPTECLEDGIGSVVPVNSHCWIISIPNSQCPGQWSVYELSKIQNGWKIISLDSRHSVSNLHPLTQLDESYSLAEFVRRERGSKLGNLEFAYELPRKDTIFLTLTLALAIQSRSKRPTFSLFTSLPSPVLNPKSYQDVCRSLHRPKRQNSLKSLWQRI